jgi:NADH-quinone oxidoreductase subunit L
LLDYVYLILVFPLAGLLLNLAFGRFWGHRGVSVVGCGSVIAAFVVAFGSFLELLKLPPESRHVVQTLWTWFEVGDFSIDVSLLFDPLSAVMCLVVTFVGALIHIYSTGYMHGDSGYRRYFVNMNLFTLSMLILVSADSFLLLFVGWEGVGLCSYLLIGHFFERHTAADAARKAFVVNRIGDFGFLLAMLLIATQLGTLSFSGALSAAPEVLHAGSGLVTAIALLLFLGATGKSAQIPLYIWLPDAMEGPTPVSALIHAATMVTAGVYMVARAHVLFELAPVALIVVGGIGAVTAIFAATIGLVQNDIKRVLAYSTVSQLGYMFLACGVGAYAVGIFHLMTHAFFKALLFLAAGSVIHALSGDQDMRRMGGLRGGLPRTHATMLVGCLAIAGIPPLAGFFSKDAILTSAFLGGQYWLFAIGLVAAGMTAFYMFRLYFLTFTGKQRMSEEVRHHMHESPFSMTGVLMALAFFSIVAGLIWVPIIPGGDRFGAFLEPVFSDTHAIREMVASGHDAATAVIPETGHEAAVGHEVAAGHGAEAPGAEPHGAVGHGDEHAGAHHAPLGLELMLMGGSVLVALIGIFFARRFYVTHPEAPRRLIDGAKGLYRTILNKYYVDEIYRGVVVKPLESLSYWFWRIFDVRVIDGLVDGVGGVVVAAGTVLRLFQNGYVGTYAFFFVLGVVILLIQLVM